METSICLLSTSFLHFVNMSPALRCSLALLLVAAPISCCQHACFDTASIPQNGVAQMLARVSHVAKMEECAKLCVRDSSCAAIRHRTSANTCDLLTAAQSSRHVEMESSALLSSIWVLTRRGLGACPADFNLKWRHSRYKLSSTKMRWMEAKRQCESSGNGKLAELRSREEVDAVSELLEGKEMDIHVGGLQSEDGEEPAGGWVWYRSKIPISKDWFGWRRGGDGGEPNQKGEEDVVVFSPWTKEFGDWPRHSRHYFLCECLTVEEK